jgi:hypothetical protein
LGDLSESTIQEKQQIILNNSNLALFLVNDILDFSMI